MKPNLLSDKKVIITAAITGGIQGKWANPCVPITPEEQAQDALECYNAGASICHLHVRREDGQNTPDLNVYNKAVTLIKEKCPIITLVETFIWVIIFPFWHHKSVPSKYKLIGLSNKLTVASTAWVDTFILDNVFTEEIQF